MKRSDESVSHFEAQSTNFLDDPDVEGVVVTVRDVTERWEMEAQLRHQALHDPLTGLPNRTLFEDRVAQAITRLPRTGHMVAVIYADIDDFKSVNDSLGHASGDELLRTIARRLDSALRASDTAGGGRVRVPARRVARRGRSGRGREAPRVVALAAG